MANLAQVGLLVSIRWAPWSDFCAHAWAHSACRYKCVDTVEGYAGLDVRLQTQQVLHDLLSGRLPVPFRLRPLVYVHRLVPLSDDPL